MFSLRIGDGVYECRKEGDGYWLRSPDGDEYTVTPLHGLLHCTCPSFRFAKRGFQKCKHTERLYQLESERNMPTMF